MKLLKQLVYRLAALLPALLLAACFSEGPVLPASLMPPLAQNELVTLTAGDKVFAFTARLESDGQNTTIVAITPTGQRLFTLNYKEDALIAEPGPLWPKMVPLQAVWTDIVIAHADADTLAANSKVLAAEHWQASRAQAITTWRRGDDSVTVRHEAGKIQLTRPYYQLDIEVLPE